MRIVDLTAPQSVFDFMPPITAGQNHVVAKVEQAVSYYLIYQTDGIASGLVLLQKSSNGTISSLGGGEDLNKVFALVPDSAVAQSLRSQVFANLG